MAEFNVTFIVKWNEWSKRQKAYPIDLKIKFPKRTPIYERTGVFIEHKYQWNDDKKEVRRHPNQESLNRILENKKAEQKAIFYEHLAQKRKLTKASIVRKEITSFFEYMKGIVSAKKATTEIGRIERYFKREPSIHEIDYEWLRRYEKNQRDIWEDAPETIKGTFKVLRTVTNTAVAEGYIPKIVIGKGAYKVPKGGSEKPTFLIQEERDIIFKAWQNGDIKDPSLYKTLTYYLLACYSGQRFGDLEQFDVKTKVVGDQIAFNARKNKNLVCYPITKSLNIILEVIRKIGPLNQSYDLYNNKNLKELEAFFKQEKYGIDKEWGKSHRARHAFGRLLAENEVTIDDCAIFMGINKKTAEVYFHLTGKIVADRNKHLMAV